MFGGHGDEQSVAYGDVADGWPLRLGCALPYRFPDAKRNKVRGFNGGKSIVMEIVDVGPWNWTDPYWKTGARPRSESQRRNRQKADDGLIPTNDAGIDLTPAAGRALGIDGVGKIDWEFVTAGIEAEPLPILRRGSTGSEVRTLQQLLGADVDGGFGPQTQTAVEAFQEAHGLTVDGISRSFRIAPARIASARAGTRGSACVRRRADHRQQVRHRRRSGGHPQGNLRCDRAVERDHHSAAQERRGAVHRDRPG